MAEVKRGYRKVTVILPVREFDLLTRVAADSDREPGQQAAFILKRALFAMGVDAIKDAYNGAVEDREAREIVEEAAAEVE